MGCLIVPTKHFEGEIIVPADKSISHRSLIFNALTKGNAKIQNLLGSDDVMSTVRCLRQLGIVIEHDQERDIWLIDSTAGLRPSVVPLDCGNSGTTMRILTGVLATQSFHSVLIGDDSLSSRPMGRVIDPIKSLGVQITGQNGKYAPITIHGRTDIPFFEYLLPIPSAQVKTALGVIGLLCNGANVLGGKNARDHSERMLTAMGAEIQTTNGDIFVTPGDIHSKDIIVPGDFSSSAFVITAGVLSTGNGVVVKNVNINPTRTGFLTVLKEMGANIQIVNPKVICGEPVGDIKIAPSALHGIDVPNELIPSMIDEVPLLAILACFARGRTKVSGAHELRVKESDRIRSILYNLSELGIVFQELEDGFIIDGPQSMIGSRNLRSFHDHRIAMAVVIAGSFAKGTSRVHNVDCISISFPNYFEMMNKLGMNLQIVN